MFLLCRTFSPNFCYTPDLFWNIVIREATVYRYTYSHTLVLMSQMLSLLYCWLLAALFLQWLLDCGSKISSLGVFEDRQPNHVLVNEYTAGQGIMVVIVVQ